MVVFGQGSCILANWLFSCKSGCIRESCCFRQSGCIRLKVVLFGENLLYSGKCSCIRSKVNVFGQSGIFWSKVVVFGQKLLY